MKTIELYEKTHTNVLQSLLNEYEIVSEKNQILIEKAKLKNQNCEELISANIDFEIDIHLIRMELNKRLWCNN